MSRHNAAIAGLILNCVFFGSVSGQESATISDDGVAVTLAKVPESLKLASFQNHFGLAAPGTRVLVFEKRRDPVVPVYWVQVKLLEGQFKGQTAWVMEPTVHKRKEAANVRIAREGASDGTPSPKIESDEPPANATHWIATDTWLFSTSDIQATTSARIATRDWVQKLDGGRYDATTKFYWWSVRVLSGKHKGQTGWIPSSSARELRKVIIFAVAYNKKGEEAFKYAANTQLDEIEQELSRRKTEWGGEPLVVIRQPVEVASKDFFLRAWSDLKKLAAENNATIYHGGLLTHASVQDDLRDGLEFAPIGSDSTLRADDIMSLPVLPWDDDARGIYLNGCYTGAYEGWFANRNWCPAELFAKRQNVTTWGQNGTSVFSSDANKYVEISPTDRKLYLFAFNRGKNKLLGDGKVIPPRRFDPPKQGM